jgi:hypothetical protein
MSVQRTVVIVLLFLFLGCAQVPRESVELSTTVGRDIAEVYRAHRELAVIFYKRIKDDINAFVDEVYGPYQIKKLLQGEQKDFQERKESLFTALDSAVKQPNNSSAQKDALDSMDVFVQVLRAEIEFYRAQLLNPVLEQEKQLLSAIDRSYNQIHYANSIVTGHLASIVRVHDAQEEVLQKFGAKGLREDVGKTLAKVSDETAKLVKKGKKLEMEIEEKSITAEEKVTELKNLFENFKKEIDELVKSKEKRDP